MRADSASDIEHGDCASTAAPNTLTSWQRSQSTSGLPTASSADADVAGLTDTALSRSTPTVAQTVITIDDNVEADNGDDAAATVSPVLAGDCVAASAARQPHQHLFAAERHASATSAAPPAPATRNDSATSSSQRRMRVARSRSEPVVTMMMVHSERAAYHQKVAACDVRRSKSGRVRTYLKRCRDALIGSIAAADTIGGGSTTTAVCPIIRHEAIEQRASCTSWYVDETAAVAAVTGDGVNDADTNAAAVAVAVADSTDGNEEDVCADGVGRSAEEANPIDLPSANNSVACQSIADAADCCCVRRADADYVCNEDQLSQSSADTVLDMDALMAQSDRLIAAEQQQSRIDGLEVSVKYV